MSFILTMLDVSLETLIARARKHTMTAQERREQGLSFVVGSGAVEGTPLHRGTVSVAVPASVASLRATVSRAISPTIDVVPFDIEGVLRQFDMVRSLVEVVDQPAALLFKEPVTRWPWIMIEERRDAPQG